MDRRVLSPSLSPIDDIELRTSVKIGIALYPTPTPTPPRFLFMNAEAAH